jgi:hypothetical protein
LRIAALKLATLNLGKFNTLYLDKALILMLLTSHITAQIMHMGKWAAAPAPRGLLGS